MEIFTLLKANIRYRKGPLASILLLTAIIAASLTTVISAMDNGGRSIAQAHRTADTGELCVYISGERYTEELERRLKEHPLVAKVTDEHVALAESSAIRGKEYKNQIFLAKLPSGARLIRPDGTAYESETPQLQKGEIYVSKGLLTNLDGREGDPLVIRAAGKEYLFTVKGTVLEPFFGAFTIGYKKMYISSQDLEQMRADAEAAQQAGEGTADILAVTVWQKEGSTQTSAMFRRMLNLDTGITDAGFGSMTKDLSVYYTMVFLNIVAAILTVFILLLTVIVLIVMRHSISSGIEMDEGNLGILKSYGFGQGRIRLVYVLQYLLTELAGALLGIACAAPLTGRLDRVFWPITAVVVTDRLSLGKSMAVLGAVLVFSCLFVFLLTAKIGKISPVRAISGGRSEIYFDSRWNVRIFPNMLMPSLALRQFVSGRRRYGAAVLVAAILTFFMMTMTLLANLLTSKTAVHTLGSPYGECKVRFQRQVSTQTQQKVRQTVEQYTAVENEYYWTNVYFSIEGEETMCIVYQDPEQFSILKGRAPLYKNEIVLTEIQAQELDLSMGDEAVVGFHGQRQKYLVSGICQCVLDTGKCFGISLEGAESIGFDLPLAAAYSLKEPEKAAEAVDALNEAYADLLEAEHQENILDQTYQAVIYAVRAVIYSFSIIFAMAAVQMVCAKAVLQEKTDLGIYKAVGFTVSSLRMQFALRFLIVAALGAAAGICFSVLCSGKLLSMLLRGMGITSLHPEVTVSSVAVPAALVCGCFFAFSYLAAGRVRRVAVRELVQYSV